MSKLYNSYNIHISNGTMTLSQLSKTYGVAISDILDGNPQGLIHDKYYDPKSEYYLWTVSKYLNSLKPNEKIMSGVAIRIPNLLSGSIEEDPSIRALAFRKLTSEAINDVDLSSLAYHRSKNQYVGGDSQGALSGRSKSVVSNNIKKFNCYFYIIADGKALPDDYYLPVYPNEVVDSSSANFQPVSPLGRSVDYQVYNGSGRSISLTLNLHEELVPNDYNYIHKVVAALDSACYPEYSEGVVKPPEVVFRIGKHFRIRGIISSLSTTWAAPIIDGKLVNCNVSLTIQETLGPYSMSEIRKMQAWHKDGD